MNCVRQDLREIQRNVECTTTAAGVLAAVGGPEPFDETTIAAANRSCVVRKRDCEYPHGAPLPQRNLPDFTDANLEARYGGTQAHLLLKSQPPTFSVDVLTAPARHHAGWQFLAEYGHVGVEVDRDAAA
jgi:hypothetical protein